MFKICNLSTLKKLIIRTSLMVQWVRLCAPYAGDPGSVPGWGTRSCMHAATKRSHAATKKSACHTQLKIGRAHV